MPHLMFIPFLFVLGACIGSFLNVVVYRMPRQLSLVTPPSRCPDCQTHLAWYDNIPVLGWIFLAGKCRYCRKPISIRYPIVEAITGLLFVFYYVMFFIVHAGPCREVGMGLADSYFLGSMTSLSVDWPIYALDMLLISGLLAASLIDAELFIIPASIPWWIGGVAVVAHAVFDSPNVAGNQLVGPAAMALSAGSAAGLIISIILLQLGILPMSFPQGDLLEVERDELERHADAARARGEQEVNIPPELTSAQVRAEMRKEMLFLMPPLLLGGLSLALHHCVPAISHQWQEAARIEWLNGLLGSLLGGFIGAFVVWLTRILGSYGFGREAMGLGDVHLMFAVGAVLGGGAAVVAFFMAPLLAILIALYMLATRSRRQLPYGPYLSLATAVVMLFYCPIAAYFRPGLSVLAQVLRHPLSSF
jgi:leader peptidase (prepilin peptidase)/N-methyltransferase